jgi:hypothetical protein
MGHNESAMNVRGETLSTGCSGLEKYPGLAPVRSARSRRRARHGRWVPYEEVEGRPDKGGALSRIIGGILAIIAIYFLFIYNDGALFMSFADWLTDLFTERIREDRQP